LRVDRGGRRVIKGKTYLALSSFTVNSNITLYAIWVAVPPSSYTVTFNINGGTGTTPSTQTVSPGANITLPTASGFSRSGYTFAGWSANASGTGGNYSAGSPFTPTANTTLYARWIQQTAGITIDVRQIIDSTPLFTNAIRISHTNSGYPATYTITLLNASEYDVGGIKWEIEGVGVHAGQTITGSNSSFTLDASDVRYNSLGGHALTLTVIRGGLRYRTTIPFTIVP
jgi:uncharacterized repeat protein (TIGR02543 family)